MLIASRSNTPFPEPLPVQSLARGHATLLTPDPPLFPGGHTCELCGRHYRSLTSLIHHRKVHDGATTCHLCGRVSSRVSDLRTHLQFFHGMPVEEIRAILPLRGRAQAQ